MIEFLKLPIKLMAISLPLEVEQDEQEINHSKQEKF